MHFSINFQYSFCQRLTKILASYKYINSQNPSCDSCAIVIKNYPSESDEKIIHVKYYPIIDHNFRLTFTTAFVQSPFDCTIQINGFTVFERLLYGILDTDTTSQS
jgi:hypothetical protein